jgi:beta-lactamase class D
MKRPMLIILVTSLYLLLSCSREEEVVELKQYFEKAGYKGSFVMFNDQRNRWVYHNKERCEERLIPASTFKIVNSLIALETGVMKTVDDTLQWDGHERDLLVWNQDHNMITAFKYSVVWFYRELARRITADTMMYYLNKIENYGNMNITGDIDKFWLDGSFKVSQMEQINMLRKLYKNDLPFSNETMEAVKLLMKYEETPNYIVRAKTGASLIEEHGWFIGWVEERDEVFYFATNIMMKDTMDEDFLNSRIDITYDILDHYYLLRDKN